MSSLQDRSRQFLWHPCTQMKHLEAQPPLAIVRGEGPWLIDEAGKRYLDAISSWWVNLFGHANPRINAAITDQLSKIEHVMLAGCTHEPVVQLSERLARLAGLGHAFYGSDGAAATEIALKMSFHFWRNRGKPGKCNFISLQNGYHGETVGALSVTDVALFKDQYAPLLRQSAQMPSPDFRLAEAGETAEAFALRCADALEAHLQQHADSIAAFILEPLVQGAAGMAMYSPAYLARARELCTRYGVHLIADEIAVGFGRTGTLFACEQAGVKADFMCLSKGISGGYLPLSCVLTTDEVYAAFYADETARGFLHSHSYTGNPLACRAALAVLDIFEADGVLEANRKKAETFGALLEPIRHHPRVRHFRNRGMIWAFDVAGAAPGFARAFAEGALAQGVLLRPIGAAVYFMPPYVMEEAHMEQMARATQTLLDTID
ncbi:adenosylmethionine--8-amino-7-oxononanoate transaminase [Betaproteobacteria bacterium SCN2]|jgi:adenosylmethionine-8-amino-7-oxononanoate aminotransferase|nr:adenosylmethionine--8-amino-7-oxononanoate transaminase [Betaproteobacteria bacterium SCN2]